MLVVVVLASSLAALIGTASATSANYEVTGFVEQPGASPAPVPAGVTVDLVARGTGAVYSTTTTSGGQFKFTQSATSNALGPGYWGLYVPAVADASITGCHPYKCAILPQAQTPTYQFLTVSMLNNPSTNPQILSNVVVRPYNATLSGHVTQNSADVAGATLQLLSPVFNGLVLSTNTTNSTGHYNLSVPYGNWVLSATHSSGSSLYSNVTQITIKTATPTFTPVLAAYSISGRISSGTHYITTVGNATLFDQANGYIYTNPTPPGGYYSFPTYPGKQFYVILSPTGYQPVWYAVNVTTGTPTFTKSVKVSPIHEDERGVINTTLDFTGISPSTGKGNLVVTTDARLGNESEFPGLPNGTVGLLWSQLGLDFGRTLAFDSTTYSTTLKNWLIDQGPFFPATQAATSINGTTFVAPKSAQGSTGFSYTNGCTATCGLTSAASLSYGWTTTYALNGTIPTSASAYSVAFRFAHPSVGADVYNYTVDLPTGYVLAANTAVPANTSLVGAGKAGTWTSFTLVSKASSTTAASATFRIVKISALTAAMSVTSKNAFFSSANVLNSTRNYYTVVLGEKQNATYSAAATTYPEGTNGTSFYWNWGNGHNTTTKNVTTNYTYAVPNGTTYYADSVTVTSSSGNTSTAKFFVWVLTSAPTAVIDSNATAYQKHTVGTTSFLLLNWTTTLHFNATTTAKNLNQKTSPNRLAIATYTLTAKNFTSTENFSATKDQKPTANWTVAFGVNTTSSTKSPGHGYYRNFANITIGGLPSGLTGFGWVYNLTQTVYTVIGTTSKATLEILVLDTQPPVPVITLQTLSGKTITGGSVTEGPNRYINIRLIGNASKDYGNGSIVTYKWFISNTGNSSFVNRTNQTNYSAKYPSGKFPIQKLYPKSTDYQIRLTVTDKNGNKANTTTSLDVAINTSSRPVMEVDNLTGPSTVNAGTGYTFWANVTPTGGTKAAIANDVTVSFYLLSPSGTGSKSYIGGSPGSVQFYGYTNKTKNAVVNTTLLATGLIKTLAHERTVRAVLHWTPAKSGSFILYAEAQASNQFVNGSSQSIASTAITVHPNPTLQLLEYGGIGAAVVIVLAVLILWVRRRNRKPAAGKPSSSGRSGLERGKSSATDDDDE